MRSLPQVLHEAAQRNASEIVLESGESAMIRTAAGSEAFGDVLSEGELFDALGQVLGPEQQAELAVGNVVEFNIEDGSTRWSLVTEAGAHGIVVRGRCANPERGPRVGISLDLPPLEHSDDAEAAPPMRASVLTRATRRTALDLAASRSEPETPDPASASSSGGRPSWLESNATFDDASSEGGSVDFELRDQDRGEDAAGIELPESDHDLGALLEGGTVESSLAAHLRAVSPGTLCLVHRPGGSEGVAPNLPEAVTIDDATVASMVAALERDPGTTYLLRVDDPSAWLGWTLRRLEEGARVFVETRARTFEGARRVLLGLSPSTRADAWLAAHRVCWLAPRDGAWILER
jgi:hypothetical protein